MTAKPDFTPEDWRGNDMIVGAVLLGCFYYLEWKWRNAGQTWPERVLSRLNTARRATRLALIAAFRAQLAAAHELHVDEQRVS